MNPFARYFQRKIEEIRTAPRYFGISVIGSEQILAALTLGHYLKERFPEVPIVIGGSVFSRLVDRTEEIGNLFGRYFDAICRYEGEAPLAAFLEADDPLRNVTPSMVIKQNGELIRGPLAAALPMTEVPTPNFDGLELQRYFTPDVVLPLLTTRGCYWDKCAFCYHGMIYGDRYRMRSPQTFAADVALLHAKHGVRHFALNDEAIPPKLFEQLPKALPRGQYYFTGLYKFEKYFKPKHFEGMYDAGFRSLYIGLESASERVQKHMRKNNTQGVMLSNLRDAHNAGIWNHTFNFFGFPTETTEEAEETISFLIENADMIHSERTGTFSFEHNAPIDKQPNAYGVKGIREKAGRVLELYYDYDVESGLSQEEAAETLATFQRRKAEAGVYQYGGWIPREQLLVLLSYHDRDRLRDRLSLLEERNDGAVELSDLFASFAITDAEGKERYYLANVVKGRVFETNVDAVLLLQFMPTGSTVQTLTSLFPGLDALGSGPDKDTRERVIHPTSPTSSSRTVQAATQR